jgi:hypothetical protein
MTIQKMLMTVEIASGRVENRGAKRGEDYKKIEEEE